MSEYVIWLPRIMVDGPNFRTATSADVSCGHVTVVVALLELLFRFGSIVTDVAETTFVAIVCVQFCAIAGTVKVSTIFAEAPAASVPMVQPT